MFFLSVQFTEIHDGQLQQSDFFLPYHVVR